ncbi:MAG: hypothetical protein OHK0028_19260 [Deltaproteobacteria bacterium]
MNDVSIELLVLDDGEGIRGYDCRDVLRVEAVAGDGGAAQGYRVRLGRLGPPREVACRGVLGSVSLSAREIRPVPAVLKERMKGEVPWAVGMTERGLYLLY